MAWRAKVRLAVGLLLSVATFAPGCASTIDGRPVASPAPHIEPNFPTPRPKRTPPTPTNAPPPTSAPPTGAPPGAVTLTPDHSGYVFIETKSRKTRCQISRAEVGCESQFTNAPIQNGVPANGVKVSADGTLRWIVGNLGDIPVIMLGYQTYRAAGWTIAADSNGTRFTNDATGHGMLLSVGGVEAF